MYAALFIQKLYKSFDTQIIFLCNKKIRPILNKYNGLSINHIEEQYKSNIDIPGNSIKTVLSYN